MTSSRWSGNSLLLLLLRRKAQLIFGIVFSGVHRGLGKEGKGVMNPFPAGATFLLTYVQRMCGWKFKRLKFMIMTFRSWERNKLRNLASLQKRIKTWINDPECQLEQNLCVRRKEKKDDGKLFIFHSGLTKSNKWCERVKFMFSMKNSVACLLSKEYVYRYVWDSVSGILVASAGTRG